MTTQNSETTSKILFVILGKIDEKSEPLILNELRAQNDINVVSTQAIADITTIEGEEGTGALERIVQYMESNEHQLSMLIPTDMPNLDWELLLSLVNHYQDEDTIVCLRQHGTPFIEPFPAIYELDVLRLLISEVATGNMELQKLLSHAGSHILDIPKDNRLEKLS